MAVQLATMPTLKLAKLTPSQPGIYDRIKCLEQVPAQVIVGRLSDLPDGILLKIFGCLLDRETTCRVLQRPLLEYCSLALTCRSLYPAAISLLYLKYYHCWDDYTSTKFILRLIARPDLAALVKETKETGRSLQGYIPWDFNHRNQSIQASEIISTKVKSLG